MQVIILACHLFVCSIKEIYDYDLCGVLANKTVAATFQGRGCMCMVCETDSASYAQKQWPINQWTMRCYCSITINCGSHSYYERNSWLYYVWCAWELQPQMRIILLGHIVFCIRILWLFMLMCCKRFFKKCFLNSYSTRFIVDHKSAELCNLCATGEVSVYFCEQRVSGLSYVCTFVHFIYSHRCY